MSHTGGEALAGVWKDRTVARRFLDERSLLIPHREEQLAIITGLWSTPVGERFDYAGQHYEVHDSPALPKPVQSPLPIIIGGGGPKRTPALAAQYAQEFNLPFQSRERFVEQCARVRDAGRRVGSTCEDPMSDAPVLALKAAGPLARQLLESGRTDKPEPGARDRAAHVPDAALVARLPVFVMIEPARCSSAQCVPNARAPPAIGPPVFLRNCAFLT